MKIPHYVRYTKSLSLDSGHYETVHAADHDKTFCGKELNERWFVMSSCGMKPEYVTCKKCQKVILEGGKK